MRHDQKGLSHALCVLMKIVAFWGAYVCLLWVLAYVCVQVESSWLKVATVEGSYNVTQGISEDFTEDRVPLQGG